MDKQVDASNKDQKALDYKVHGGLWWGTGLGSGDYLVSWPLATLTVAANSITLSVKAPQMFAYLVQLLDPKFQAHQVFEIKRGNIVALRRKRGWFFGGMIVEHQSSGAPPFILFSTLRYRVLSQALRRHGYNVIDSRA